LLLTQPSFFRRLNITPFLRTQLSSFSPNLFIHPPTPSSPPTEHQPHHPRPKTASLQRVNSCETADQFPNSNSLSFPGAINALNANIELGRQKNNSDIVQGAWIQQSITVIDLVLQVTVSFLVLVLVLGASHLTRILNRARCSGPNADFPDIVS
jgi:hypothetical protein